jgi:putative methyltransferase (TIGR04325 family)
MRLRRFAARAVRPLRLWLAESRFRRSPGTRRGVYATFDEAIRASPPGSKVGHDLPELAQLYRERLAGVYGYDYPVLFWLKPRLPTARRVFDFGGHVGIHFYTYERYLAFSPDLRWTVCDVAATVAAGRGLAAQRGRHEIQFTTRPEEADGADVFLAAGSLQYVEAPGLASMLKAMREPPPDVIVNKVPLYPGRTYVTLQNHGASYAPHYVWNESEFIDPIVGLGYEVVDRWRNDGRDCEIPLRPEGRSHLWGLYFRRRIGEKRPGS